MPHLCTSHLRFKTRILLEHISCMLVTLKPHPLDQDCVMIMLVEFSSSQDLELDSYVASIVYAC